MPDVSKHLNLHVCVTDQHSVGKYRRGASWAYYTYVLEYIEATKSKVYDRIYQPMFFPVGERSYLL